MRDRDMARRGGEGRPRYAMGLVRLAGRESADCSKSPRSRLLRLCGAMPVSCCFSRLSCSIPIATTLHTVLDSHTLQAPSVPHKSHPQIAPTDNTPSLYATPRVSPKSQAQGAPAPLHTAQQPSPLRTSKTPLPDFCTSPSPNRSSRPGQTPTCSVTLQDGMCAAPCVVG